MYGLERCSGYTTQMLRLKSTSKILPRLSPPTEHARTTFQPCGLLNSRSIVLTPLSSWLC